MSRHSTIAQPRWFTVVAARSVVSNTMEFDSYTEVKVFARNADEAMRQVRTEFRHFHLRVLP